MSTRLPEVRPLSKILPAGTEGGKEFARIVDLLLFYKSNREGSAINIFSDRAGDYFGLDSFLDGDLRKQGAVGYQYKFYSSPLTDAHRRDIVSSLNRVKENQSSLKLKRWIIVTPDDLTQSSLRASGGDVEWFQKLKLDPDLGFEIEHWGHRKLQALFIETTSLCLFYYPELIANGASRKKTIAEIRRVYDITFSETYRRIEFVGTSVYKPEATRGVPMEDIYIPVSTVSMQDAGIQGGYQKTNPLDLLSRGGRHVVLGDPGSGKSTLLKFLSLSGRSKSLQKRYGGVSDNRIPVIFILRKYADSLKIEPDLSLIDFAVKSLRADFSVQAVDAEFLEFFLETGEALLFFDGLDELPNQNLKEIVRNRIDNLLNCYPANTAIITSRIVGYDAAFSFDDVRYKHHKLAPLTVTEMENFIADWYSVRVENLSERKANVDDLVRIVRDSDQQAIRELAGNPLLLTIIALVHRIDAVLPDERVVLYQKCTETLLNTWQTWKYRHFEDVSRRGRTDRINRRRIESLARYMHEQGGDANAGSRAVLSEEDALNVLVNDIIIHDGVIARDEAEDAANEFLSFVKQRAGLLMEVGDRQYSFIHLTFQEYLTATSLIRGMEVGGIKELWSNLRRHAVDARWHEVVRLLIADLRSDDSQEFVINELLLDAGGAADGNRSLLLSGLLMDGIVAAEENAEKIISVLLRAVHAQPTTEYLIRAYPLLRGLADRYAKSWDSAFGEVWRTSPEIRCNLLLVALGIPLAASRWDAITDPKDLAVDRRIIDIFALLFGSSPMQWDIDEKIKIDLQIYLQHLNEISIKDLYGNFLGSYGPALLSNLSEREYMREGFARQLLMFQPASGPMMDFYANITINQLSRETVDCPLRSYQLKAFRFSNRKNTKLKSFNENRQRVSQFLDRLASMVYVPAEAGREFFVKNRLRRHMQVDRSKMTTSDVHRIGAVRVETIRESITKDRRNMSIGRSSPSFWQLVLKDEDVINPYMAILIEFFRLEPSPLWSEAIRASFMPNVAERLYHFDYELLEELIGKFVSSSFSEVDCINAARFLLYDIWLSVYGSDAKTSPESMRRLRDATASVQSPILELVVFVKQIWDDAANIEDVIAEIKKKDGAYLLQIGDLVAGRKRRPRLRSLKTTELRLS